MVTRDNAPIYESPQVIIYDEEGGSHKIHFLGGIADLDYTIASTDLMTLGAAPIRKIDNALYEINESIWYDAHANRCFTEDILKGIFSEARNERVRRLRETNNL